MCPAQHATNVAMATAAPHQAGPGPRPVRVCVRARCHAQQEVGIWLRNSPAAMRRLSAIVRYGAPRVGDELECAAGVVLD